MSMENHKGRLGDACCQDARPHGSLCALFTQLYYIPTLVVQGGVSLCCFAWPSCLPRCYDCAGAPTYWTKKQCAPLCRLLRRRMLVGHCGALRELHLLEILHLCDLHL